MTIYINTEKVSTHLRESAIDVSNRRVLITNFLGTEQEQDFTEVSNCSGFGRIHHFKQALNENWPSNPLPMAPACKALGLPRTDAIRAQVFQTAICNWRCWYCFVPFNLLSASRKHSDWLTPSELIDLYLDQSTPPMVIDLTGGQPDLVPEWIPWMMEELKNRGLDTKIYLWSDDNLSNDYFWQYLSDQTHKLVSSYTHYGRVCCFKGFNDASFSFNTKAEPALFERQFDLMKRLLTLGIDIYAYTTFTTPSADMVADDMQRFVDRLQALDKNLPLRTVPLEIKVFSPVTKRMSDLTEEALQHQYTAVDAWRRVLESRYTRDEREQNIADVRLGL